MRSRARRGRGDGGASSLQPGRHARPQPSWSRFCEPRLPYFAIPRYLDFVDELPRTENGKVQKFKLRERGVTDRTRDRDATGRGRARP